jgi:hypothetical protein
MATVVLKGPRELPLRRLRRMLSATLGSLMYVIGLVGVPLFVVLTIGVIGELADDDTQTADDEDLPRFLTDDLTRTWMIVTTITLVGLVVGIKLIRGRRRLVLFLRHFGDDEAIRAVTSATVRIGGEWRFVTLDDAKVAPVGATPSIVRLTERLRFAGGVTKRVWTFGLWAYRATAVGLVIAVLAIIGLTVYRGEDPFELINFTDDAAASSLRESFRLVLTGIAIVAAIWGVYVVLLLLWATLGVALTMALGSTFTAVRDAEQLKRVRIGDLGELGAAAVLINRWRRKVISPRLIVLDVDSTVWREAVWQFSEVAAVPLIDVSEPTENLVWEIQLLIALFGNRCVFVADVDQLGQFADDNAPVSSTSAQVRSLIGNRTILAYATDARGERRFARALRATLRSYARRPLPAAN